MIYLLYWIFHFLEHKIQSIPINEILTTQSLLTSNPIYFIQLNSPISL